VDHRQRCVEVLGKVEGGMAHRGEGSTSRWWRAVAGEAPAAPGGGGKCEGWLDSIGEVVPAALTMKGKKVATIARNSATGAELRS
jgi:hypothetical protein